MKTSSDFRKIGKEALKYKQKNPILSSIVAIVLVTLLTMQTAVLGVAYLPDVTPDMSKPEYWTKENNVLMSIEEIAALNNKTISTKGTYMYDLKNQPETIDGIALNEGLLISSKADAAHYLGWTYLGSDTLTPAEKYDDMISNTQNPDAANNQPVLYGIAVRRTELRTFPSPIAIWDDPSDIDLDYQYLSSVRVNEPLVITSVSADGKYYLAKNICCSGWVEVEDVAICADKAEWLSAWDIPAEKALVIYGDKVYTEASETAPATSELMLTMGTVLELAETGDTNAIVDNRAVYQNHVVWMPVRNDDGSYSQKLTLISEHNKVSEGYLPLTKENISKVAFSTLGNTYGWGGGLHSDDCSGYIRNIYKCFGIELARNTTWQTAMPMAKIDMSYMCREERVKIMDSLPFGSVLYFDGHEMLYLGSENGKYYVISSVGSIMNPNDTSLRQRIRSTVINTLDIKRANGNNWLDSLTAALVPYLEQDSDLMPKYEWDHDGVAYCLKSKLMQGDEDKLFNPDKAITRAELVQIMWNAEEQPESDHKASYADISEDKWYYPAICWAAEAGLVNGDEDGFFTPEDAISREDLAVILMRYAGYKGLYTPADEKLALSAYTDKTDISEYAIPAMAYASGKGFITGKTDETICPLDSATRAETAVILQRFLAETNSSDK